MRTFNSLDSWDIPKPTPETKTVEVHQRPKEEQVKILDEYFDRARLDYDKGAEGRLQQQRMNVRKEFRKNNGAYF